MSSFSGNWAVTSSWKLRTLFQKATCFPGKAQEEHKEQGRRRDKKPCFLLASTVPPLVPRSQKSRKGEENEKAVWNWVKVQRPKFTCSSELRLILLLLESQSFGLIMTCFKWQCQHIVSTQDNTTMQTLQPDIWMPDWPRPLCGTQHFYSTQPVLNFFKAEYYCTFEHLKKKIHNKKKWPRSFSELCYCFKVTKTNIHIPSLITVN